VTSWTGGAEIRVKFDTQSLSNQCQEGFIFALRFKSFSLPEDAVFKVPGATVTYISPDRTVVTIEPNEPFQSWNHDFWNSAKHDGTRVFIYANNLSGLKSVENLVVCQDFAGLGQTITDLSCLASPGDGGTPIGPSCNTDVTTTLTPFF